MYHFFFGLFSHTVGVFIFSLFSYESLKECQHVFLSIKIHKRMTSNTRLQRLLTDTHTQRKQRCQQEDSRCLCQWPVQEMIKLTN